MQLNQYVESIRKRSKSVYSKEHAYRTDLETLIRELVPGVDITNEPSKVTDCGNPDYVITKGRIPIGFIEAKDVGVNLNSKTHKEQFDRYKNALDNLIITDYLWFQFYQHGKLVHEIRLTEIENDQIQPLPENFTEFTNLIKNFCEYVSQTIKSPKKLAGMMAAKARLLDNILENALTSDEKTEENTSLKQQYETFKSILIHDLTPPGFADIYAQTLAYGMFAARLHDRTLETFSRQEAAELIPKTNPFLRKLFNHVAGPDIDERIVTTVDNLADVFRATNVDELLKNFGKSTQTQDPIIHFYETFLAEYNPKLRKARGVWYTPEPVVKFIVRSVDEILKTEFGLKDGLADTSKTTIEVEAQGTAVTKGRNKGKKLIETHEVHKVQVLDPATGTGTFLAEVVRFIHEKKFTAMQGAWSGYVEDHLIPRLNGFELLMASYAMAHLKLDLLLSETGYQQKKDQRFNIYLTNSLEEHHPDTGTIFSTWLSTEANEANRVKRDIPVMVVMGNPPYSVSSSNKSEWIEKLMKDYKKNLNERNIQPLSDDYIKFIRYGQHFIEKTGEGILAYISNNSFIDGVIHRQMRKELLESFDKIYILNLHGNSKKKETAPDGSKDENVFDIMQGVSINFFIKKGTKQPSVANLYHSELFGKRHSKNDYLLNNSFSSVCWKKIDFRDPEYFYIEKDYKAQAAYERGFSINRLFKTYSSGIKTHRDNFVIDIDKSSLETRLKTFFDSKYSNDEIKTKYSLKDNRDWKLSNARQSKLFDKSSISTVLYRPFDFRNIYYDSCVIDFDRKNVMENFIDKKNVGIIFERMSVLKSYTNFFISDSIVDLHVLDTAFASGYVAPLYLYPESNSQSSLEYSSDRVPNLDKKLIQGLSDSLGLRFSPEKEQKENTFAPIDILDYIYAVLHSPSYRENYKEFLKIDFPRIPYPNGVDAFWSLVDLGGELRRIHLLEADVVEQYITTYPMDGDNQATRKIVKKDWELYDEANGLGRIWINDQQYFDQIPLTTWEFYIGGYQPAQKWLKDRSGRTLSFEDILHYQKIIVALSETYRLMQEIDKIDFFD